MANFVNFPAPLGMLNMDYVSKYSSVEIEGVFGINVYQANGYTSFSIFPNTGVSATVTTGNLTYTADAVGTAGNAITVDVVVAGLNTVQSIGLVGTDITFNSGTDGGGLATNTEIDVKNAFDGDVDISALIDTFVTGDGSDAVTDVGVSLLIGGTDDDSEATRDTFMGVLNTNFLLVT